MQRAAQDWLVLTQLSHTNASAVGTVMALQFLPMMFLLPITGTAADRINKRKLLIVTQASMAIFSLGLGLLTVSGIVRLWHMYVFALLMGCAAAFDMPARQSFMSELVADEDLHNAIALNTASFSLARIIGPAVAGITIARFGCGWVFIINAISFLAVVSSLVALRENELRQHDHAKLSKGGLKEGMSYILSQPNLAVLMVMVFVIGTFGVNYSVFISAMSAKAFHLGPKEYGFLTSLMGVGSVSGALLSAKRKNAGMPTLCLAAGVFGLGFTIAALMPNYVLFGLALTMVGLAAQTFSATANSTAQLTTVPSMRGRVMAVVSTLVFGGTPLGAPLVGFVADKFGPRASLGIGAAAGFMALAVGVVYACCKNRQPLPLT